MLKRKVEINLNDYPSELHYFFKNTEIFDSNDCLLRRECFFEELNNLGTKLLKVKE